MNDIGAIVLKRPGKIVKGKIRSGTGVKKSRDDSSHSAVQQPNISKAEHELDNRYSE